MTVEISEDVALRLEELAKRHDVDLCELLRDMIERYDNEGDTEEKRWATTADLARNAKEAELSSAHPVDTAEKQWATLADLARNAKAADLASPHPVDTSARSREILNTEYADYLKRRANR